MHIKKHIQIQEVSINTSKPALIISETCGHIKTRI